MKLYEAINGMIGCSYVRKYVFAENYKRAEELAGSGWNLTLLFNSSDHEFVTKESDEGFEKLPNT